MYEWKTLRVWAGILLCLPLVHFTYIVAKDMTAYLDPSPEVWKDQLAALVETDTGLALPDKPVVVVGGQRVRLWQDLPKRLRPRSTLMRPLGDATLEDITYHFDRLVAFYRPDVLVIFPGYADLHLRDNKNPDDYQRALGELLDRDESLGASQWRYVISPIQMPLHQEDQPRVAGMAAVGRDLAGKEPRLTIIDPNPMLIGVNGKPDPSYFRADGINLNDEGYALISLLLHEAMRTRGQL